MSYNYQYLDAKISAAEKQLKQLKERKAKAERQARAAIRKQERANDTRCKILLGALWLEQLKNGQEDLETAKSQLDGFLTRDKDRELFGLAPLHSEK